MTLGVGDRFYASANWVPPFANYPGTVYGEFLAKVMRQLYLHIQHHGRHLGSTNYGFGLKDISTDAQDNTRAFAHTTWVDVHRSWVTIGDETSHVGAWFVYALHTEQPVTTHLSLAVFDGTDTDTQTRSFTTEQAIPVVPNINRLNRDVGRGENPFSNRFQIFAEQVEVALSTVDPAAPGRCHVHGRMYAVAGAVQRVVQPFMVRAYSDMRY